MPLQSVRAYACALEVPLEGICLRKEGEVELRCCLEPPQLVRPKQTAFFQKARRRAAQQARPTLWGVEWMDIDLAAEVRHKLPMRDRPLW